MRNLVGQWFLKFLFGSDVVKPSDGQAIIDADVLTPRYEMGKATEAKIISVKPDPQEAKRWTNEISG